jgi:glycosyltransferase involved in cell wall biosynthesis
MPVEHPLVSVVVATYNGAEFIRQQLDSIIGQTYPNIEVLVVDDCSTDGTWDILQEYAAKHSNFIVIRNEKNIGYVKNFEKGMLLAKGEFICPSDQDDVWHPEKTALLIKEREDHAIIYCNSELIDSSGKSMGKKLSEIKRLVDFDDPLNYVIGGSAPGHAMLVTREVIRNAAPLPEMIPHDYWIAFVGTFYTPLKFLDIPLVYYRQHNSNVFGAVKNDENTRKKKPTAEQKKAYARERMQLMYEKCPDHLPQKAIFRKLNETYQHPSLQNNFSRMKIFLKYRDKILAFKHRSAFRKLLYSLKMLATIK